MATNKIAAPYLPLADHERDIGKLCDGEGGSKNTDRAMRSLHGASLSREERRNRTHVASAKLSDPTKLVARPHAHRLRYIRPTRATPQLSAGTNRRVP